MDAASPRSSSSTFQVRRALPEDSRALAAIYNGAIRERIATFETDERSEAAMRAWLVDHDDRHPVLVGEESAGDEGLVPRRRVVAWASIGNYRPRPCYDGVGEFSIYVGSADRGRGVGERLLRELIDEARRLGYWKLVSRIFPQNVVSRHLAARCGFREVGVYEKHGKLDGRWLDTVIVERLLPENLR